MNSRKIDLSSYLLGLIPPVFLFVAGIFFIFDLKLKNGFQASIFKQYSQHDNRYPSPSDSSENQRSVLRKTPSKELLDEIKLKGGNFDNVINLNNFPTGKHLSFAVTPHQKLRSRLKSNISIRAHSLKSKISRKMDSLLGMDSSTVGYMYPIRAKYSMYPPARNMDPPILNLDNKHSYSKDLEDYIASESIVSYLISSNELGFRNTFPISNGEKEVLVIGDSVAFGLGVDDRSTVASHLQKKIGDEYKVINAALSGYGTKDNFAMIDEFKERHFSHLIYIICANDLHINRSHEDQVLEIIERIEGRYLNRFDHVTVVYHTYIYGTMMYLSSCEDEGVQTIDNIKRLAISKTKGTNISFISWADIAKNYSTKIKKTFFAVDALYVDHCHFSSEGNELLASSIQKSSF